MGDYRTRVFKLWRDLREILDGSGYGDDPPGLKGIQELLKENESSWGIDQRALAIAITELETGLMWLDKATS